MNQPTTIRESIKIEGWKGFQARFKDGLKKISPQSLLKSEIMGIWLSIIGTLIAVFFFVFIMKNMWPIALVLGFNIIIQASQLIGKWQQLNTLNSFNSQSVNIEEFLK